MHDVTRGGDLASTGSARSSLLAEMLGRLDDHELNAPSRLPGWSRLTIVCHVRYGASALARMTADTLCGRMRAYYPEGRARQRPVTLQPDPGASPTEMVARFAAAAAELDRAWQRLNPDDWARNVTEPDDNRDLGTVPLGWLAMSRLLEIDVHGTDLGIGFPDWTEALIEVALPTRLAWLARRRANHGRFDRTLRGSWLLVAHDGPRWFIAVDGDRVESRAAEPEDEPTATIRASGRDLLALLLGRPTQQPAVIDGDLAFGQSFSAAFPGP